MDYRVKPVNDGGVLLLLSLPSCADLIRVSSLNAQLIDVFAEATGEVLDVLIGNAAGARTPGHRPLQSFGVKLLLIDFQTIALDIAVDDFEESILFDRMEAEPQAKAIRQRDFFFDGLCGVNGV